MNEAMSGLENLNRNGRSAGSLNAKTRALNKRFQEAISNEEYEQVIRRIVEIALSGGEKYGLAAAKYIVERFEGRIPEVVQIESSGRTINDLLNEHASSENNDE